MNFSCLLFILVLSSSLSSAPEIPSDLVPWSSEKKLQWADFKGKVESSSSHDALSHCGLAMDLSMKGGLLTISVEAVFDPALSWVKDSSASASLLSHEQLHFDIYERYARELRKRLSEAPFSSDPDEVTELTSKLYKEVNDRLLEAQHAYDQKTDHSLNRPEQLNWEKQIAIEIRQFNEHDKSVFERALNP